MSAAKQMLAAFQGSQKGHGRTQVGRVGRNGKTEAKSFVIREPLTEEIMQQHIDGTQGIGSIPIKSGNVCMFGALDIDKYDLDHASLSKKIKDLNLPLFHCRSKSGGAHLYLFLKDWEPASMVREILDEMASAMGYSGCEIFPKQDTIREEEGDLGNFINLPYFRADETMRYCFDRKGKAMSLDDFLKAIDKGRVAMSTLTSLTFGGERKHFTDGPFCLETMAAQGPITEYRNIFMFNVGVYCRNKWPDNWREHHEEYNRMLCEPPLPSSEIVQLQKSLDRKDYYYQCEQCPLKDFCNKQICKTRPYGVGNEAPDKPRIGGLTIMLSEPRLYFMDVNGKRVVLAGDQLQHPSLWQRACMEQADMMPPTPKAADWQQMVNGMMSTATKIDVPEELTYSGRFREHLKAFCTSRIKAMSPEELDLGKPWTEDGLTKFKIEGLMEYLKNRGFTTFTRAQVQDQIKQMNDNEECYGHQSIRRDNGKRSTIRVWWVPAFDDSLPELKEPDYDIPF
jgi:hypothetical protein